MKLIHFLLSLLNLCLFLSSLHTLFARKSVFNSQLWQTSLHLLPLSHSFIHIHIKTERDLQNRSFLLKFLEKLYSCFIFYPKKSFQKRTQIVDKKNQQNKRIFSNDLSRRLLSFFFFPQKNEFLTDRHSLCKDALRMLGTRAKLIIKVGTPLNNSNL